MNTKNKTPKRYVPQSTRDKLFAWSGNQCAFPGCKNPVIQPATKQSPAKRLNQICHIYSVSEKGPRGKNNLTNEELNSIKNLILFCPTHHIIVDSQHETYPATLLKQWKYEHESRVTGDFIPEEMINQVIEEEINTIIKSRFFLDYNITSAILKFAKRLTEGDLFLGDNTIRCHALAHCARFLYENKDELDKAEQYLSAAKNIGTCSETEIAEALMYSAQKNADKALEILSKIHSSSSRSAAFIIIRNNGGKRKSIQWLKKENISPAELDSDGKLLLIIQLLNLGFWNRAKRTLEYLTTADINKTPALHHVIAITSLLMAVPSKFRHIVLHEVPFVSAAFPLDVDAMEHRKKAQNYFNKSIQIAKEFHISSAAKIAEMYMFWLKLMDSEQSNEAKKQLREKLRDSKSSLHLIPLGIQFKIGLNLDRVQEELNLQKEQYGHITKEIAMAQITLFLDKGNSEELANYLEQNLDQITKHFDKKAILFLRINMLAKAGLITQAKKCLKSFRTKNIAQDERKYLQGIIAEQEGIIDPIESRKKQFEETKSLSSLMSLVDELVRNQKWEEIYKYGAILFRQTRSVQHAEQLSLALHNTYQYKQVIKLSEENANLLKESERLRTLYSFSLYYEGNLLKSQKEMEKLIDNTTDRNYRLLQMNLMISTGNWDSLRKLLIQESQQTDNKDSKELMNLAQLALHMGLQSIAKNLTFSAVEKNESDAEILASAYFLAVNAGWEYEQEIALWLEKLISHSNINGPIREITLREIIAQVTNYNHRENEIARRVQKSEIPLFIAAPHLNKSLIELTLSPALMNLSKQQDIRSKKPIAAYSENHDPERLIKSKVIGMDITALLTLAFLNLLDKVFNFFEIVYIPHSTLVWLFEEKQRASFHQPNNIKNAHLLQTLLTKNILKKCTPNAAVDNNLSQLVGIELATLITEAENNCNHQQRVVVRSLPIYRIDSFMEEEIHLEEHAAVMSSCFSIIEKLQELGQITYSEVEKARSYFRAHEKPWPKQPKIHNKATLYLDSLSVEYFLYLGILKKLQPAGFEVFISSETIQEVNALISYEEILDNIKDLIENIRAAIAPRIVSGRVKLSKKAIIENVEYKQIYESPTNDLFFFPKKCGAVILDDRFFNQHAAIPLETIEKPIYTTLNILETLYSTNDITVREKMEYKTRLRCAGYFFIPIENEELKICFSDSQIKDNNILEIAELKQIRENILHIRMYNDIQLTRENIWLQNCLEVFSITLKNIWLQNSNPSKTIAFSNWLLDKFDFHHWIQNLEDKSKDHAIKTIWGRYFLLLFSPPSIATQEMREGYCKWLEKNMLLILQRQYSNLFDWLIEEQKKMILEMADIQLAENKDNSKDNATAKNYSKSSWIQLLLTYVHPLIFNLLVKDKVFVDKYNIFYDVGIALNFDNFIVSFQRSKFLCTIRNLHAEISDIKISDTNNQEWKLINRNKDSDLSHLYISRDKQTFALSDFSVFLPDKIKRLSSFNHIADCTNLPLDTQNSWRAILSERTLHDEEMEKFLNDIRETPANLENSIHRSLKNGIIDIPVPLSRRYYERLIGIHSESKSIREYAVQESKEFFSKIQSSSLHNDFLYSLLLSSHASLTKEIKIDKLEYNDIIRALSFLETNGDKLSQLGIIEIGFRFLQQKKNPDIELLLIRLIEQMKKEDVNEEANHFDLISALFILVDAELSRSKIFLKDPPFYRRLASLTHVSLVHRQLVIHNVAIKPSFIEQIIHNKQYLHSLQSMIDMRLEPYYNPSLMNASLIKDYFLDRIITVANDNKENIHNTDLQNLVLGNESGSIHASYSFPGFSFPGPLDGDTRNPNMSLPSELSEYLIEQLNMENASILSLIRLGRIALTSNVSLNHAELASKAIKSEKHKLINIKDRSKLLELLHGLATVAATTKSHTLANELRSLVYQYRYNTENILPIEKTIEILLTSAASRTELHDWRKYISDFMTELAFGKLNRNDGEVLHACLLYLCHIDLDLWSFCGQAEAALQALIHDT